MTDLAAPIFDAEPYEVPRPKIDGKGAERISVTFGGGVELDWRISEDLDFVNALELGQDITITITATVAKKGYSFSAGKEGEPGATGYGVGLRVHGLEVR